MAIIGERLQAWLRRGGHGLVGAAAWLVFLALALLDVAAVRTFYYALAWYPALLVVDAITARRRGWSLLSDRPLALLSAFAWSVPFWLLFEAINLRIENWYYVGAPRDLLLGRVYMLLSFATVLPGLVLVFDLLGTFGSFSRLRSRPFRTTAAARRNLMIAGVAMLVLPLLFPGWLYALVWGFLFLLLEPLCRRPRWPSLLKDLERGRPGRLVRLLAAGMLCGLYWEIMNMPAGARWIYTVPFFDRTLGVEMPPLGFVGFLPFALEGYAFLRVLEIAGMSAPFEEDARGPVDARVPPLLAAFGIPGLAAALSFVAVVGVEERTVDATAPAVAELPGIHRREAAVLALDGVTECGELLTLAAEEDGVGRIARRLVVPPERVEALLREARLAAWRGLGTENAALLLQVGIRSVDDLLRTDPEVLYAHLRRLPDAERVRPQRVRVWCRR